jgi:hypothetical protein
MLLESKNHKVVQEAVSRYSFQGNVDRLNLLQVFAEILKITIRPPSKR